MAVDVIGSHYTTVFNEAVRDRRLSRRARGLLVELLSHRDGYGVSIGMLLKARGVGHGHGYPPGRPRAPGRADPLMRLGCYQGKNMAVSVSRAACTASRRWNVRGLMSVCHSRMGATRSSVCSSG